MTTCKTPLLVSLLAKLQELPVSQLAMQGPEARLFSGRNTIHTLQYGSSYKAHYPLQLSFYTLNLREAAWQSVLPINISFLHLVWSLFGSSLYFLCKWEGSWAQSPI
jgi:hypothetical protein